jgi:hypothetical protein
LVGDYWYRLLVHVDYRLLVQVDYKVIGTGWLQVVGTYWYRFTVVYLTGTMWQWFHHLTLIFQGGWMGQGKGVVASFWLVSENQKFGASFKLEPEN